MVLHLSGSAREEVNLVQIETEDLTLIIRGKPYHRKYEGLNQYRSMDFHDYMEFKVVGAGIKKELVYDVEEMKLVEGKRCRPIFFENSTYQVLIYPKKDGKEFYFYHEYPLLRQAVSEVIIEERPILMGTLHFQNEVGLSTFEIRSKKNDEVLLEVTIEIYPTKLDYKDDYKKLIDEVNDEIYNLAYHFIRKTYHGASIKVDGKPSMAEFYRLILVHFQSFVQAINHIEIQPHHLLKKTHVKARGDQLGKLDSKSRSYLRKNSHLFAETSKGISIHGKKVLPVEGVKIKKELTYDTLENRFVKWMIGRLIHKLEDLLMRVMEKRPYQNDEPDEELVEKIEGMIGELKGKLQKRFWRSIGKLDRSVMSLVLQMAPGYRDAYQLFLTVSKGLVLKGNIYRMSVKDVATLYEYWTYLKLGQILSKKYIQVSQDIVKVRHDGLFVNLDTNQSARRVFVHPITNEKIVLSFQKSNSSDSVPTTVQKPDTTLSIEKKGQDYYFNYIFDAKYRIDFALPGTFYGKRYRFPGPLEEDINTMHRYRDSLVVQHDGPYERIAFGAYVLFPWGDEDSYKEHHFYKSIDKVNVGGLPFLPNATDLVEQFLENLINKSPEQIQNEGILPIGREEEWRSSLDEKVLVGVVSSKDEYRRCIYDAAYTMPVSRLKKGWQDVKYVALYLSKEVGYKNGVASYGKINEIVITEDEKVCFKVNVWIDLQHVIKPVNYGIANYALTTFNVLKDARELPELFMKSRDEVAIWRMLRRVSDNIKIELDDRRLDYATNVQSYEIKDGIKIWIDAENVAILGKKEKVEFKKEDLRIAPTKVFKAILKMLE